MKQKLIKEKITEKETKDKVVYVKLKPLKLKHLKVKITGISPFLPEPMDYEMLERYDRKKSLQTFDKDTKSQAEKLKDKFYYFDEKKKIYGIPKRQFKSSMTNASTYIFDRNEGGKRNIREGVRILGGKILPLKYKSIYVEKDWGKASNINKTPTLILRNAFVDWSCEFEIEYNESQLSVEQIMTCLNYAGFYCGVGAFRKNCGGEFGMFSATLP